MDTTPKYLRIPERLNNDINLHKNWLRDTGKGKKTNREISEEALNQMFDVLDSCDAKTKRLIRVMFHYIGRFGDPQLKFVAFEAENSLQERAKKYAEDYNTYLREFGSVACSLWQDADIDTDESASREPVKFPENDVG